MKTCTGDLLVLFEHLDLKNAMLVGHSTGGGEVSRFLGRHSSSRFSKAVLVDAAIPPFTVLKESNPNDINISVFDGFHSAMVADLAQFFLDVPTVPFFGFNLPSAKSSQGLV
jgi:non-heme chloroperoxidase